MTAQTVRSYAAFAPGGALVLSTDAEAMAAVARGLLQSEPELAV